MIYKTFKYRLYPGRAQIVTLEWTLARCCELYNAALQERRDAYKIARKSISYFDQAKQLPAVKAVREDVAGVYSQVLQEVLKRVEKAFDGFFRRVKAKRKAGFPRFRPASRFDSFTYPQRGFRIEGNKLNLSKIGSIKIKLHRPVEGRIKTCTVKREAGRWYACLVVECEEKPLPTCAASIGVDVGLSPFATLSDGTQIENPRYYKEAQERLRRAQRRVSRRKKGSERRRKAAQLLARIHQHIGNQRADFHHKMSRRLIDNYGTIAVEDLNVRGLAAGRLAKSVNDAGWSQFFNFLRYKAANAGREFVEVRPHGTSQTCLCGADAPKTLSQRWHQCTECGLSLPRDHVSAQIILNRALGLSVQASSRALA